MPMFDLDVIEDSRASNDSLVGTLSTETGFGLLDSHPEKKLKGIIEISRGLAQTVEPREILPKILEILFEMFPSADRGSILLKNPKRRDGWSPRTSGIAGKARMRPSNSAARFSAR